MQPHVKARAQDRQTTVRGMTLVNFVCCTTVSLKLAAGLVWCGLVCPCLVWSGLVWPGLVSAYACVVVCASAGVLAPAAAQGIVITERKRVHN